MSEMIHITVRHPGGQTALEVKKSTSFLNILSDFEKLYKEPDRKSVV